jgi:hypothetical protein
LENTENNRVWRSQPADLAQVPVCHDTAVSPAEIARISLAKTRSIDAIFLGKFQRFFHGTETESVSTSCEDDIRIAREKHHVSTGTLGT